MRELLDLLLRHADGGLGKAAECGVDLLLLRGGVDGDGAGVGAVGEHALAHAGAFFCARFEGEFGEVVLVDLLALDAVPLEVGVERVVLELAQAGDAAAEALVGVLLEESDDEGARVLGGGLGESGGFCVGGLLAFEGGVDEDSEGPEVGRDAVAALGLLALHFGALVLCDADDGGGHALEAAPFEALCGAEAAHCDVAAGADEDVV
mmetsp:Transcript_8343/g.20811  ORF Transcript_8343/g.20811 Transcript_8343/m.20811 type:complete len:207 (-) Transcript_8343:317-937(-)